MEIIVLLKFMLTSVTMGVVKEIARPEVPGPGVERSPEQELRARSLLGRLPLGRVGRKARDLS
jgi:hypothetical protein